MNLLDEPEGFAALDPADALGATLSAPQRFTEGLAAADGHTLPPARAVLLAGMGGSGIAGDVLAAAARASLATPILLSKDADLPAWVGPDTPVVALSHSGHTEETRSCAAAALEAGAPVTAVTSGGPLADQVAAGGGQVVTIPGGGQPRHALGHLAGALAGLLGLAAQVPAAVVAQQAVVTALGPHAPTARNPAKLLAGALGNVATVEVWAVSEPARAAAVRLACQLEEHAKLPAGVSVLPELAHNEIVGWQHPVGAADSRALVVLRDPASETAAARDRLDPAVEVVAPSFAHVAHRAVSSPGDPPLARIAALCLAGDLTSVYAAYVRGVDPTPIAAIDTLKAAVAAAREA